MPEVRWSRFVLSGTDLLPGQVGISSSQLSRLDCMIEIRRSGDSILPIEALKELAGRCKSLMVDPHTFDHQELIDCLMLGSSLVCIDHRADVKHLQLAHASSANIVVKLELDAEMLEEPEEHFNRLRELSSQVGDFMLVKTRLPGILEEWWESLPRSIRNSWRWIMAPAEGQTLPLSHSRRIHSWAVSGDIFLR